MPHFSKSVGSLLSLLIVAMLLGACVQQEVELSFLLMARKLPAR